MSFWPLYGSILWANNVWYLRIMKSVLMVHSTKKLNHLRSMSHNKIALLLSFYFFSSSFFLSFLIWFGWCSHWVYAFKLNYSFGCLNFCIKCKTFTINNALYVNYLTWNFQNGKHKIKITQLLMNLSFWCTVETKKGRKLSSFWFDGLMNFRNLILVHI